MSYLGGYDDSSNYRQQQVHRLLSTGWRPLNRELDLKFLAGLVVNDTQELTHKWFDLLSNLADAGNRRDYNWLANLFNLFSANTRYHLDDFWSYITPNPPGPDHRYLDLLMVDTPVKPVISRDAIAIDHILRRLQEIIILKTLNFLGRPSLITQSHMDRYFCFPVQQFTDWEQLEIVDTVYAYWDEMQVWLRIDNLGRERRLMLMARDLSPLIRKVTYGLAVMLSGYQSRVGQLQSQFPIHTFPPDIQAFADQVQQAVFDQDQLAVLVSGEPGTGKTVWAQAVAKEILMPLGYVTFILDHEAVQNFVPPSYLQRICLIINEADNLAQDRAQEVAQYSNKTEHILSLLDGTLYRSVMDEGALKLDQRLVVLMTCNTTERMDPAVLRKGRVDLMYNFTHRFV
jgi:hypothetical protein